MDDNMIMDYNMRIRYMVLEAPHIHVNGVLWCSGKLSD